MPYGVVSGVGQGMDVLDMGGDRRRRRGSFEVNLGSPIVTNGEFVAQLCASDALFPNYSQQDLSIAYRNVMMNTFGCKMRGF